MKKKLATGTSAEAAPAAPPLVSSYVLSDIEQPAAVPDPSEDARPLSFSNRSFHSSYFSSFLLYSALCASSPFLSCSSLALSSSTSACLLDSAAATCAISCSDSVVVVSSWVSQPSVSSSAGS